MSDAPQPAAAGNSETVPGRSCGSCSLCCKILAVRELEKPENQWCNHFKAGRGCTIYDTRPGSCRRFYCGFMRRADFGEEWRPSRAHFVLYWDYTGNRLLVHVDPAHPNAWKEQPYYRQLKWMSRQAEEGRHIIVRIKDRLIVILPHKDYDLGEVNDGDVVQVIPFDGPLGRQYHAQKVAKESVSPDLAARAVSVVGPKDLPGGETP